MLISRSCYTSSRGLAWGHRRRFCSPRAVGPERPPSLHGEKPPWLRILEEDAAVDEDVAELLAGANGDPDVVRARMEARLSRRAIVSERGGSDAPPRVTFREVDPFELWVWLELCAPPTASERDMLSGLLRSWFIVGKLGGYDSSSMQVYHNASGDLSYLDYDNGDMRGGFGDDDDGGGGGGRAMPSLVHELGEVEHNGQLARFRVDLGTADEVALDVLINALRGFSRDVAGVRRIAVGGRELGGWALPGGGGAAGEAGRPPKVGIDPMRLPEGLDDDVALLEELGMMQDDIEAHKAPAKGDDADDADDDDDEDDGPLLSARGIGPLLGGTGGRGWSRGRAGAGAAMAATAAAAASSSGPAAAVSGPAAPAAAPGSEAPPRRQAPSARRLPRKAAPAADAAAAQSAGETPISSGRRRSSSSSTSTRSSSRRQKPA